MPHSLQDRVFALPLGFDDARVARDVPAAHATVLDLFDAYRDGLYRYVRGMGTPARDSEDVVQDVFLALFHHLARGGARTNLRGWVFRVASNMALKRRAREARWTRLLTLGGLHLRRETASSPEDALMHAERQQRLLAVLQALPDRDRQCVLLRAEGLRYRDIALVLGISLGAVANSLARALTRLHRADGG